MEIKEISIEDGVGHSHEGCDLKKECIMERWHINFWNLL